MTTGYCFLKLTREKYKGSANGYCLTPVFPKGVVGRQQYASSWAGEIALYEYSESAKKPRWQPDAPVGEELALLLDSAKHYPPALALAREDVDAELKDRPWTESSLSEFADVYTKALRYHLQQQCTAGYIFARAVAHEPGYLYPDHWYWVVGAKGDPALVQWISSDLEAYTNMATDFDLSERDLTRLRNCVHRWLWWSDMLPSTPFTIVGLSEVMQRG